jgi:tellurite resistance protein TerC
VLRGAFIAAGSELLARFDWVVYIFGALLLLSGVRMLRGRPDRDPEKDPVVRLLRRRLPTTRHLVGPHLILRADAVEHSLTRTRTRQPA